MDNSKLSLLNEAIEIIGFAESIENRIQSLRSQVERLQFRIFILVSGITSGAPLGFYLGSSSKKNEIFDSEWILNPFILLTITFFSLAVIFGTIIYTAHIWSEYRHLKKELAKERMILSKLVDLADHALSEIDGTISLSQQALLETRLQRIAFERL